ncbi:hypothetical protein ACI65C_011998 [Semiaphis heraclei]
MTSPSSSSEQELHGVPLVQKFNANALEFNTSLEQKWINFKKEYEELYTCLEEFPKQLSVPILMPVGPKVFVRAQLCNTNEVFIRYNDVFTKQSAHEAKAVCERQIKKCDSMIEDLRKERKLFTDNICARQDVVNVSENLVEINEPYDEAEEAAWKEIHRQKVKEYKKRLADEKEELERQQHQQILDEFKSVGFDDKLSGLNRPTLFTASKILVTEIDDIVERVFDTCLKNETDDKEENTRPISRFKSNRNR